MIQAVVMAGGIGSRLWPLSRAQYPKQFLPLVDEQTMLQSTLSRVIDIVDGDPLVICHEDHRFIVAEQVRQIGVKADILLEPVGRNTAPTVALAALAASLNGEDPLLLVLAADHIIEDVQTFQTQIMVAKTLAEQGLLVTFGVVPQKPETGYGYIRCDDVQGQGFGVAEFVEKPDEATAKRYVESGEYYWNSGMFLFKASRYLEELAKYAPDILKACQQSVKRFDKDLDFLRIDTQAFEQCPEDSIDYAVMEKSNSVAVVPLDAGWSDVGSWSSLWDVSDKDEQGNVFLGDVLALDTKGSLVKSSSKLVATLGLTDTVVVETKDAVLVADKNKVQDVKRIVAQLKDHQRSECSLHREEYRPWGKCDAIDAGERYQVKRITVEPGCKLSVQMHHHRAEHWVVVSGTAKVGKGTEEFLLTENESIYIPVGCVHWLENPGKIPLDIIEVQSGSYLGEDDIIRLEDKYGRLMD